MKQSQISDTRLRCRAGLLILLMFCTSTVLLAQTDSVRVVALNSVAGESSLYSIHFTLSDTLYPDAEFGFSFPPDFDVSGVTLAGSRAINGGFAVKVLGQKVLVKRKGRGAVKMPGEQVDVMFSTVSNPVSPAATHKINMAIKNSREATHSKKMSGVVFISDKKVR